MGTLFRALVQAASTSVSPQAFDVSGETRTPKAAVYQLTSCLTAGTLVAGNRYGCGMTDGTSQRSLGVFAENGVASNTADAGLRHDTATVVQFPNAASTVLNGEGNWDSWNAGGSDIVWGDFLGNAFQILKVLAMEGDWTLVEFAGTNTENDTKSVTGLSYAPDFVISLSHYNAYAADSAINDGRSRASFGYAIKTPAGGVSQVSFTDVVVDQSTPTDVVSIVSDTRLVQCITESADGASLEVTAWTSDGLTLATRGASTSVSTALLIGRTNRRLYAGIPTVVTSSTGNKTISDPGFEPEGYFMIGTRLASKNSRASDATAGSWSRGIYTGHESGCVGVQTEHDVATSDTRSIADTVIAHVLDDAGTIDWKASHVSMASTGPTINIDDASASDRMLALVCWSGPILVAPAETVNVQDAQLFVTSALHANETVNIQDAQVIIHSTLQADETVNIEDAQQFTSIFISGEEEDILDGSVLVTAEEDTDLVFVSNETENIEEASLFVSTMVSDETINLIDAALLNFSALHVNEEVDIQEAFNLAGFGVAAQADETVQIQEAFQMILGGILSVSETVNITDAFNFGDGLLTVMYGPERGRTVEGGAERGVTIDGGSLKGSTL